MTLVTYPIDLMAASAYEFSFCEEAILSHGECSFPTESVHNSDKIFYETFQC